MKTVLLAEDDNISRHFLSEALRASGYRCDAVADGAAALRLATTQRFDLLLLDVNLPLLSGPEIVAQLRATTEAVSRTSPAVALTADPAPTLRQRLIDAGFAAVGHKPVGVEPLHRLLQSVLRADQPVPPRTGITAPWDDAIALRAVGGNHDIVAALRALMLKELPAQRSSIVAALERADLAAMRHELHRLRAACGFCGAAELAHAVDELHASSQPHGAMQQFLAALDRTLAGSAASS